MRVKDWRGIAYDLGEPLRVACTNCGAPAVRNACKAEGNAGRTHWHGLIHVREGSEHRLRALCRACADNAQEA